MIVFHLVMMILTTVSVSGAPHSSQPDSLCLDPAKLYPFQGDCRKFIRCVDRKPVTFSCPPKTAFDAVTQICVWRLNMEHCDQEQNSANNDIWNTPKGTIKKVVVNRDNAVTRTLTRDTQSRSESAVRVEKKISKPRNESGRVVGAKIGNRINEFESSISNSAARSESRPGNVNSVKQGVLESHDVVPKPPPMLPVVITDSPLASTDANNSDNKKTRIQASVPSNNKSASNIDSEPFQQQADLPHQMTTITVDARSSPDENQTIYNKNILQDIKNDGNRGNSPSWLKTIDDNKMFVTETVEDKKGTKANDVELSDDNTNISEASTTENSTWKRANNSLNKNNEKGNYSTSLNEFKDLNARTDSTESESETPKDSLNRDHQADVHRLDRAETTPMSNSDNVTENNIQDDLEDETIIIERTYSNNNPTELNTDPVVLARQHQPRAKHSSQKLMLYEENTQIKKSYVNQEYPTSQYTDANTDQEILPLQSLKNKGNTEKNNTIIENGNTQVFHGSTGLLTEQSTKSNLLSPSRERDVRQQLYNEDGGVDNISNNLSLTAETKPSTSSPHLKEELKSHDTLDHLESYPEESTKNPPVPADRISDITADQESSPKYAPVIYRSQIADLKTLSSSKSASSLTDLENSEEMVQKSGINTPSTTTAVSQAEGKLNASFMAIPYMVKGLVRPFRCSEPDGHFVDPKNCSVYYHCSGGHAYRRDCPAGQVFHLAVLSCVTTNLAPPCPKMDKFKEDDAIVKPFHCENDGYFRDSKHCNVYYICAGGSSMRMTCDAGTSFDVKSNLCMWNSDVHDCKDTIVALPGDVQKDNLASRKAQKTLLKDDAPKNEIKLNQAQQKMLPSDTSLVNTDNSCSQNNAVFPDADNCSVYYICSDGVAKRMLCPHGTGYDVMTAMCVESSQVHACVTGNRFDDTSFDMESNLSMAPFTCPDAHGLYPDPSNCSIFIHCFKKVPYRHKCQPDTVFSSEIGICTWRELVPECQEAEGIHGLDHTKMINSVASQQWHQEAPMEPYQQHVYYSENPESDFQGQPVELQDFTCPNVADGFFRDNLFCDIFHRCVLGTRFTFTCPTGTFFRLNGHMCDFWETITDCTQDGLRVDAVHSLPEIAPLPVTQLVLDDVDVSVENVDADPTPCPEASGLFAHPRNCRQFLFCAHFVPLVLTCPETLLYNTQTLTCDLSKNVQCLRYDDYLKK